VADASFEIAYDGDDLRDHAMDVQQLAPALLSLGNLIRDANAYLNADRSRVRVLVQSDFEHKCFSVSFDVVQTIFEQARTFLDHVKTSRELLEVLGLVGLPGVFGYLQWRKGRKVERVAPASDTPSTGLLQVQLRDGSKAEVHQHIYQLAERPDIKRAVAGVLAPMKEPGIDRVQFREQGTSAPTALTITEEAAADIRASCETAPIDEEIEHEPQPVIAHLRVRSPTFDPDAKQWRSYYGEDIINVDITETNIAANAIARGGVMIDDLYTVKLLITEHETASHQFRKTYKVVEVLNFKPAPRQTNLFAKD
jgi:hypothetical protein